MDILVIVATSVMLVIVVVVVIGIIGDMRRVMDSILAEIMANRLVLIITQCSYKRIYLYL